MIEVSVPAALAAVSLTLGIQIVAKLLFWNGNLQFQEKEKNVVVFLSVAKDPK